MNANEVEQIFSELIAIYDNLKAESVVAELMESLEISPLDFLVTNRSTFSRPYRRDIISVDNITYEHHINLNLSRNGLYDQLPQGLFHQDSADKADTNFSQKRKKFKKEEQHARRFFSPIENEFFFQRLNVELAERELLDKFYKLKDTFLLDFWNISSDMPKEYLLRLIKVLPYCYKISGDLELTRQCLEGILDEVVSFKLSYQPDKPVDESKSDRDEFQLGMDLTLNGEETAVLNPLLEVTIGPVPRKKVEKYLKKEGIMKFINTFYDYFIPLEIEVDTKFISTMDDGFMLSEDQSPLMGVTTRI